MRGVSKAIIISGGFSSSSSHRHLKYAARAAVPMRFADRTCKPAFSPQHPSDALAKRVIYMNTTTALDSLSDMRRHLFSSHHRLHCEGTGCSHSRDKNAALSDIYSVAQKTALAVKKTYSNLRSVQRCAITMKQFQSLHRRLDSQ